MSLETEFWFDEPERWSGVPSLVWADVRRLLPPPPKRRRRRRDRKGGRPRLDDRLAFSGLLWLIRTGNAWHHLPPRFGSARTTRRRVNEWLRAGMLERMFRRYLNLVPEREVRFWADVFEGCRGRRWVGWLFTLEWTFRNHDRAALLALEPRRG